jgi:DUF1680 family protein
MRRALVRTWLKGGEVYYVKDHEAYPFDSYSPLYQDRRGKRCGGVQLIGEGRSYGCCVCIGSAGTAIMGLFSVMKGERALYVNLYNDTKFRTELDGLGVRLDVRANPYEANGARIRVEGAGLKFALALRVPTWAEGFSVSVDGEAAEGEIKDGYFVIDRVWDSAKIDVKFRASVKMRVINGKIAFTRGAVALARDTRFDDISKPLHTSLRDGKSVRARRVKNTVFNSNVAFEIATKDGKITLTDYAQAGKNYDSDDTGITVWQDVK